MFVGYILLDQLHAGWDGMGWELEEGTAFESLSKPSQPCC